MLRNVQTVVLSLGTIDAKVPKRIVAVWSYGGPPLTDKQAPGVLSLQLEKALRQALKFAALIPILFFAGLK